ncbi:MAG: PA0069 family radical SAM protein [Pseudomonadota bacterium]
MDETDIFNDMRLDDVAQTERHGRAAGLNMASRFDRQSKHRVADGWHIEEPEKIKTRVDIDSSRTVLARNNSPDVPFDRSINPYRGCEHGCIYCFARPTHAQLGFSPGLDFETRLLAKPNAPELLAQTLRKPGYSVAPIAIGTNTDPYQPVEKQWRIMRGILDVLWDHRHPVTITTKGSLITRDIDILSKLACEKLIRVTISLTTLNGRLSRAMEPRAAAPGRRIAMVKELSKAGIPTTIGIAPVVPGLTDHELERLIAAGAEAGADYASYIALRLPLEVAPLFRDWLAREYPERAAKVMGRVRELHGGKDYDSTWHKRLSGEGVHASLLKRRFTVMRKRFGLDKERGSLRCDLFRVPPRAGDQLILGI